MALEFGIQIIDQYYNLKSVVSVDIAGDLMKAIKFSCPKQTLQKNEEH